MPISMTFSNESADGILADLQRIFPALVSGGQLPPMQEQPAANREPLPESNVKEIEPKPCKSRTPKEETGKKDDAPSVAESSTEAASSTATTSAAGDTGAASETTASPSDAIPDIEDLRARLKTLGATEGFGHDKVFEVLGKYGAKNASTVPEEKRADCIEEIDELLKAGAK
ncbi:hypothetical protein [Bradyrhizobium stylosanthis]|uniref:Uncharacterized protein n=1 Tax=Bradyrhizobium stylosanthis TaxID=1803665 RepID=A0A560CXG6_9BRAD|nr:hypothetical protein [Bradyrhizobium stylosanthis]TWA89545.1 hypothetical protein FBZ96_11913 [Bradyrhizobium stylosanthis]